MEVAVKDLLGSVESLKELSEIKMVSNVSLKIAKIIKKINTELELVETQRTALIKEFGETLEDGNVAIQDDAKKVAYFKEWLLIFNSKVNLDIEKINVKTLLDRDGKEIDVKSSVLLNLEFLLES